MKYEVNVRCNETGLGTVQNTFGGADHKERTESGEVCTRTRGTVLCGKANRGEVFRLATDRPGFRSVRRIEPDTPILTLTPSSVAVRKFVTAAMRKEEQPLTAANDYFCRLRT